VLIAEGSGNPFTTEGAEKNRKTQRKSLQTSWLGGLDSNQDNQIQSLMYYRLYDLPAV
jgi:hypothetical protein